MNNVLYKPQKGPAIVIKAVVDPGRKDSHRTLPAKRSSLYFMFLALTEISGFATEKTTDVYLLNTCRSGYEGLSAFEIYLI